MRKPIDWPTSLPESRGESLTTAVTVAVRERLERLQQSKAGSLSERLLKIGKDCAVPFEGAGFSAPSSMGTCLYDEKGLPKMIVGHLRIDSHFAG